MQGVNVNNNTLTPTKTDRECGLSVRSDGKEIGRSRKNRLVGGMGK